MSEGGDEMAATTVPVVKGLYVCDDIRPDPAHQRLSLSGVMNSVRASPGSTFPYALGRMCVFAQLEDGAGEVDVHVLVVSAATGQVVFHSARRRIRFPTRLAVVSVAVRLLNCPFPAAGEYWVELYLDDAIIADRVLHAV